MKKNTEGVKSAHLRRPNEVSPPKKEFELLYRERDPEQPYENIIFMKSKKCEAASKRKSKEQPVQELKDMVAQLERQLKDKPSSSQDTGKKLKSPSTAKNLFKNKQIKETFHSKTSSRWNKYKKQEVLTTENVKKYKNMLSPTRAPKLKEETVSSKFLRTTQETFRKEKTKANKLKQNNSLPPFSCEPEEYILLQDNFVELTHEEVNFLQLKIASNKAMQQIKSNTRLKPSDRPFSIQDEATIQQPSIVQGDSNQIQQFADEQNELEEQAELYAEDLRVMELFMLSKVKLIQSWWRGVLSNKHKPLDPIMFRKCREEFEEGMLFLHSSDVSPIKMIDQLNADRKKEQSEERPDSLRLREQAAEQQLKTHLQLLQQLLEEGRINGNTFFEKKALIEAKYAHELQQIQELQRLMSENTQRAYQITIKTQQDRTKLQNNEEEVDQKTLDQIFGKDFSTPSPPTLPQNYEMMVINREKSTGCHFDNEEKIKPSSIYQKNSQEDYTQDFQEQDDVQGEEGAIDEYNANFSQLLDEYKSRQQVKIQIDKRAAIQMGALVQDIPEEIRAGRIGIDTSLNSIHRFVLSFFKFYIFYYKDQFLRLINMPYGYSLPKRLSCLHGYDLDDSPQQDENGVIYGLQSVISDEILDEFYEKVYDLGADLSAAQRANFQFERVHSRALLDCFNEAINQFRPYFLINGPPYPWNHSEKALTFYYIAEENIQQVFEKTQFKLLRWSSSLCGIIPNSHTVLCPAASSLPVQQALELYRTSTHPDLIETREDRQAKNQKIQITENNHNWGNFEQQSTMLRLECSNHVFTKLFEQLVQEFWGGSIINPLSHFDFFEGLQEKQSGNERA